MSHIDTGMESDSGRLIRIILVTEKFQCVDATFVHRLHPHQAKHVTLINATRLQVNQDTASSTAGADQHVPFCDVVYMT